MFWKPTLAVQADFGSFLLELTNLLQKEYVCDKQWIAKLRMRDEIKEQKNS